MKAAAIALAIGTMLTVEQRDARRSNVDHPSAAVSADGRFVAFTTYSQLARADTNASTDVYVLDRVTRRVTLESANTGRYTGSSHRPGISGDGRHVVFERAQVIMLRDRREGVTRIIGEGSHASITENGRHLVFAGSGVEGVADPDVNGHRTDIYLTDLQGAQTRLVSVEMQGRDASVAASDHPSASSDGRYVAFVSRVQAGAGRASDPQVFVRDTELNTTRRAGAGWDPSISGDGRFVAFVGLSNRLPHIFLADLQTGATRIITNSARRGLANGASGKPKVSSDGRFVAFQSEASDLVAAEDFNLLWDVFVFDRTTGTMTRVSGDPEEAWMEPSGGPSIDGRGSVVAFSSRHPTDASDKRNDFDLYVATVARNQTLIGRLEDWQIERMLSDRRVSIDRLLRRVFFQSTIFTPTTFVQSTNPPIYQFSRVPSLSPLITLSTAPGLVSSRSRTPDAPPPPAISPAPPRAALQD